MSRDLQVRRLRRAAAMVTVTNRLERPDVPRLLEAEAAARELKAFADAAPDQQPDAE